MTLIQFQSKSTIQIAKIDKFVSRRYLLCRLTIEVLNESVQAFNTTIAKKYKFMNSSKMSSMKDQEMKRYQAYKAQENVETRGKC